MKIVFFGTPEFAVASLDAIIKAGHEVAAIVTMPDKPAGRGHHMFQSPVKVYAVEHGIPVLQPVRLKDENFIKQLQAINAPLFVVIAFRMLPEVVWQMPPLGTFNLHGSLLPKYRGAAPINWAVMNGETETGVTTFFLQHEIDTGDIIDRVSLQIGPDENVGSVHDRLMALGASLTVKTVEAIEAGTLTTTPQKELTGHQEPTPAPKIFKETCRIDWSREARAVHNHVRGLSPYPAAWSILDSAMIKIFATNLNPEGAPSNLAPSSYVVMNGTRLFVGCSDKAIEVLEVQPQGKRRMMTADYLRGARIPAEGQFE